MIKLKDSNIVDILPEVFANDAKVQALGYAIQKAMQRFLEFCDGTSVYAIVDKLPDKMLAKRTSLKLTPITTLILMLIQSGPLLKTPFFGICDPAHQQP